MTNREFFIQRSASEYPAFLNVVKAVPAGQLAYRPHPRSRSAEELLGHLIGHEEDLVELATTGSINHRIQVPFGSIDEAVELYRKAHEALASALSKLDDKTWEEGKGQFVVNGKVFFEGAPRDLGWMMMFDAVHHRGQLSAYLRPMGGKVPSIYGPSADDPGH